jgi:HlyD family secretion protein
MIKPSKLFKWALGHKFIAGIIVLVIIFGGYFGYKKLNGDGQQARYVLAAVEKGTLITSVSGSGQISASNQIDVKPKASGEIVYLNAKVGQEVRTGALLAQLDTTDVRKTVRSAETALQREELSLEKLQGLTTSDGTIRGVKEKAEDAVQKAYDDGFNTVANVFLDLPDVMSGLNNMLFSYDFENNQQNITYYANAVRKYDEEKVSQTARKAYDKNFQDYKLASRFSEPEAIESLIEQTYETMKKIAEAIKSANNLIQLYQDELTKRGFRTQSLSDNHLSSLNTYTSKTNSYLLNLLSIEDSIQNSQESTVNAGFDIDDQEIKVKEAEDSLAEAKEKLSDYYVYAPFAGVIAAVSVDKGDSVSSGTTLATLITKQRVAEISLNEVDVAQVKVGQKVTLTFDAIEDLSITGEVLEIDSIGAVSQGVVSYNVEIGFDTQDDRIKPGMSVSASIIIDVKQNVLLVPNSAVKSQGDVYYVETLTGITSVSQATANVSGITSNTAPGQQQIEIGSANDSYTEVTSGLNEGDTIISQTITGTTSGSSSAQRRNNFEGSSGGMMMIR